MAAALVEHGYLDLVGLHAGRGDFCCADALGRLFRERGDWAAAVEVYRPFTDLGWWVAVERIAGVLVEQGSVNAAVSLVRPFAEAGNGPAVIKLATLLARQGRVDEVFAVLRPGQPMTPQDRLRGRSMEDVVAVLAAGQDDWRLAEALVRLTIGIGRDDEVVRLLRPLLDRGVGVAGLVARVLERQGQIGEAIDLLESRLSSVNEIEQLADILARHDPARLDAFIAGRGGKVAAYRLAQLREEQGRLDEAVAVLAPLATGDHNVSWRLSELLVRHGRVDEAIEVLRAAATDEGGLIHWVCALLVEHDRADDAYAFLNDMEAQGKLTPFEMRMERIAVLHRCGRIEQAIAELQADPDAKDAFVRRYVVDLLAEAGRPDEAIAVLQSATTRWNRHKLALLLVRLGRPEEAVAVVHDEARSG